MAGWICFFVISGFIIWSVGHATRATPGQFLLRRAIRVVPPYWSATLGWLAVLLVLDISWITVTLPHLLQSLLFIPHQNPTFTDTFWPLLVPGWTLLFEMFFYALFALVLLVDPSYRLRLLSALLLGLVGAGLVFEPSAAPFLAYTSPLLLEFLGGCLIAQLWLQHGQGGRGLPVEMALGMIVAGIVLLVLAGPTAPADQTAWGRVCVFGLAGGLILAGAVGLEARMPHLPWLERLGDASYALYLFHMFLVTPFATGWNALPMLHSAAGAVGFILICLGSSVALSLVVFRRIEQPLQAFLTRSLARRPAVSPGASLPRR